MNVGSTVVAKLANAKTKLSFVFVFAKKLGTALGDNIRKMPATVPQQRHQWSSIKQSHAWPSTNNSV
jgi:hypothetical protein